MVVPCTVHESWGANPFRTPQDPQSQLPNCSACCDAASTTSGGTHPAELEGLAEEWLRNASSSSDRRCCSGQRAASSGVRDSRPRSRICREPGGCANLVRGRE